MDRDITLTAGNTTDQLVGTYRIYAYPRNGMGSSDVLKVFAKAWPNNTETNVSDAWPGTAMTASSALGSGYYYWDFNEDYASWSNIGFEFYVSDM